MQGRNVTNERSENRNSSDMSSNRHECKHRNECKRPIRTTASFSTWPASPAPSPQPAEFFTLGPGFSYGSVRKRGLHVAQQTCWPEVRESKCLLPLRQIGYPGNAGPEHRLLEKRTNYEERSGRHGNSSGGLRRCDTGNGRTCARADQRRSARVLGR